jgi:hypothetical protein
MADQTAHELADLVSHVFPTVPGSAAESQMRYSWMGFLDAELAALPNDAERVQAIRAYAAKTGAIMAVSHRFCPPGLYWADMIAPGRAVVAHGASPLAAALAALHRFTQAASA